MVKSELISLESKHKEKTVPSTKDAKSGSKELGELKGMKGGNKKKIETSVKLS
jgi:hypothetical protein